MFLDGELNSTVKRWLTKKLEPIIKADPEALSTYILALLRHKKPREQCLANLPDFLEGDTEPFVKELFEYIETLQKNHDLLSPGQLDVDPDSDRDHKHTRRDFETSEDQEFGRRESHHSDDFSHNIKRRREDTPEDDRSFKFRRERGVRETERERERERDRSDYERKERDDERYERQRNNQRTLNSEISDSVSDSQIVMETEKIPTATGFRRTRQDRRFHQGQNQNTGNYQKSKMKCRQFEQGVCLRGNTCPYYHGDPIVVDDVSSLPKMNMQLVSHKYSVGKEGSRSDDSNSAYDPDEPHFNRIGSQSSIPSWPISNINRGTNVTTPQNRQNLGNHHRLPSGNNNSNPPNLGIQGSITPLENLPMGSHMNVSTGVRMINPTGRQDLNTPKSFPISHGTNLSMGLMTSGSSVMNPSNSVNNMVGLNINPNSVNHMKNIPTGAHINSSNPASNPLGFQSNSKHLNNNMGGSLNPNHSIQTTTPSTTPIPSHDSNEFQENRVDNRRAKRGKFDRSNNSNNSTLMITNIPKEFNSIEKLNTHFKQFGTIVNIQVKLPSNKSYVQFSHHSEAVKALRSPEAVFGNRFIKVFWSSKNEDSNEEEKGSNDNPSNSRDQDNSPPNKISSNNKFQKRPTAPNPVAPPTKPKNLPKERGWNKLENKKTDIPVSTTTTASTPANSSTISLATSSSQTTTPKVPDSKKSTSSGVQEVKKQKNELRKKQMDELLKTLDQVKDAKDRQEILRQIELITQKISKSIEKDSSTLQISKPANFKEWKQEKERERLDRELDLIRSLPRKTETVKQSEVGETGQDTEPKTLEAQKPSAMTKNTNAAYLETLRNKLTSLQQQAAELGIDSKAHHPTTTSSQLQRVSPNKLTRPQQGYKTSVQAPKSRSLVIDNRNSRILVTSIPQQFQDETTIKAHFGTFGPITHFLMDGPSASITFSTHKIAEMAVTKGRNLNSHPLQIVWYPFENTPKASEKEIQEKPDIREIDEGDTETHEFRDDEGDEEDEEHSWKH